MLLEFVPEHRDDFEAASARFPGEATDRRAATSPARARAMVGVVVAIAVLTTALLLLPRQAGGGGPSLFGQVLAEADEVNDPVFVIGLVVAAVGGAMVVVPLAYAFALRRSHRPLVHHRVRIDLGDEAIVLTTPANELTIVWTGIVAFAETRHLFVLKTLGDLRLALPKRGADADALRALLRERVAPLAGVATVPPPLPPRLAA
jgi:hypothetical protein